MSACQKLVKKNITNEPKDCIMLSMIKLKEYFVIILQKSPYEILILSLNLAKWARYLVMFGQVPDSEGFLNLGMAMVAQFPVANT